MATPGEDAATREPGQGNQDVIPATGVVSPDDEAEATLQSQAPHSSLSSRSRSGLHDTDTDTATTTATTTTITTSISAPTSPHPSRKDTQIRFVSSDQQGVLSPPSPSQRHSGSDQSESGSILSKIRARELHSAAAKADPETVDLKGLTCAVCLDIFTDPKFLPCHHTYCAACIEDLAQRRPHRPFKCPSCRKDVELPPEGVQGLQHNFYIRQEDLDKAALGVLDVSKCRLHPKQDLDMYCSNCDKVVCFKCVLTKHKEHDMEDLTEVAHRAVDYLDSHSQRLADYVMQVRHHVAALKTDLKALESKMAAVKRNLQDRHDTVVAAAKKHLDQGMASVDKVMKEAQSSLLNDSVFSNKYLNTLLRLQKNIDTAIKTHAKVETVEADRDMRVGLGSQEAVDELLSQRKTSVQRPVLHRFLSAQQALQAVEEFFGTVDVLDIEVASDEPEVIVQERFRCGDGVDTEVFSLCAKDNGTLCVSYSRRSLSEEAPSEGFEESGRHQYSRKEATGQATWKSRGRGKGVFVGQLPGQRRTYSKGQDTEVLLRLDNSLSGHAEVKRETIVSENPYKSKLSKECSLRCGPHRAFDADVTRSVFAVVVEEQPPDTLFRQVLLFHKNSPDAVSAFKSSLADFQPSDVCFYLLKGKHVLLASDEFNDAIHVLDYEGGQLSFLRFLAPGCPLLIQPTALNVDVYNRLWVACRGGGILVLEETTSSSEIAASAV